MARAGDELEELIRSTGFFNAKAKSIRGACRAIVEVHGGRVPSTMEELHALPGVGRKTANVVLGNAFGTPGGVVVDTHVGRLARRLGWSRHTDPVKVEDDLNALLPREEWVFVSHALILHGRRACPSRSPRCGTCPLADLCPRVVAAAPARARAATSPAPAGKGAPAAKGPAKAKGPARAGHGTTARRGR
jgi:endonuclease-3